METFSALLAICAGNSPVPGHCHCNGKIQMYTHVSIYHLFIMMSQMKSEGLSGSPKTVMSVESLNDHMLTFNGIPISSTIWIPRLWLKNHCVHVFFYNAPIGASGFDAVDLKLENDASIPECQRCYRWSSEWISDYLSLLWFKLNHNSKRVVFCRMQFPTWNLTTIVVQTNHHWSWETDK